MLGLALGQDRHGRVVAMQPLGGQDMGFDQRRIGASAAQHGPDLIGQRRQADRHALACIALGLAVQRLMLAELLEQDHRQQARAGPAAGRWDGTAPAPG